MLFKLYCKKPNRIADGSLHLIALVPISLTQNPSRLRACAIVHKFVLSPHTKRDHDTQVKISKQTLNQLHSFGTIGSRSYRYEPLLPIGTNPTP